jgi:hypothetical protein
MWGLEKEREVWMGMRSRVGRLMKKRSRWQSWNWAGRRTREARAMGKKIVFDFDVMRKSWRAGMRLRCIGFYELVQYGWWVSLFYCKLYDCGFTGFEE